MIVYLVKRSWFTKHEEANAYRRSAGLKPADLHKVTVTGRDDLAALLNALCEPTIAAAASVAIPIAAQDAALVSPRVDVPDYVPRFLLDPEQRKIWDERNVK